MSVHVLKLTAWDPFPYSKPTQFVTALIHRTEPFKSRFSESNEPGFLFNMWYVNLSSTIETTKVNYLSERFKQRAYKNSVQRTSELLFILVIKQFQDPLNVFQLYEFLVSSPVFLPSGSVDNFMSFVLKIYYIRKFASLNHFTIQNFVLYKISFTMPRFYTTEYQANIHWR